MNRPLTTCWRASRLAAGALAAALALALAGSALHSLAAAAPAARGGQAEVRFVQPERFSDIGWPRTAENPALQALARHVQQLAAQQLPAGQRLELSLTDVDLAGDLRPSRHGAHEVRVLHGGTDYPRLQLHWRLLAGEQLLAERDERLVSLDYLHELPARSAAARDSLAHEKRLLSRWFSQAVLPASAGH
jgi:hypothetical protein